MPATNEYQIEQGRNILDEALDREGLMLLFSTKAKAEAFRFKLYRARTADRELNDTIAKGENPNASDFASPYDALLLKLRQHGDKWALVLELDTLDDIEMLDLNTGAPVDV